MLYSPALTLWLQKVHAVQVQICFFEYVLGYKMKYSVA